MSKWDWAGAAIGFLAMAGTLAAQPDPLFNCGNRVSVAVNVPRSRISLMKRGVLDNGNYVIWWDAKVTNSYTAKGFCEVHPLTGRTVRLETSRGDSKEGVWRYRITPHDAVRVCQREARERFSPGNGMLEASFLRNVSNKSTYRVAWQYGSVSRMIRKGRCDIDSLTGTLLRIHAETGWW